LVLPLRKVFPGVGGYDWASLIGTIAVAVLASLIEVALLGALNPQVIFLVTLARMANWILYGFMGMILIGAIFSWINPHAPLAPFIASLSEPLLRPLRRVIPLIGNIDLSPLAALLLLQIALLLVRNTLASAF
jgi:YggT family protein